MSAVQSAIETNAYLAAADVAGMDEERSAVAAAIAADPQSGDVMPGDVMPGDVMPGDVMPGDVMPGDVMPGCGGARKPRARKPGTGRSGGYRLITYFGGEDMPVFLLTVFGEGEKKQSRQDGTQSTGQIDEDCGTVRPACDAGTDDMKSAFDKIAAGLDDAIAFADGDGSRGRIANPDVKAIREANAMTQTDFAEAFRLKLGTVRDWEQGRRRPDTGSIVLLGMIKADAKAVRKLIAKV